MDIKEFKKVRVINTAGSRVVTHAFSLAHDQEAIITTALLPEHILNDLNIFYERGQLEFIPVEDETPKKAVIEKHTETVHTANGKESVIFKPQDKLINVESIDTTGKAIDVAFSKMDAVDLLSKHWKTLEKAVANIESKDELKIILSVAKENEMAIKKIEIVEKRLGELV
jgi:hypothetical protein